MSLHVVRFYSLNNIVLHNVLSTDVCGQQGQKINICQATIASLDFQFRR